MQDLARHAIERPLYVWLLIFLCLFGGVWGFDSVGRLEDPPFPIKNAFIITQYPGASAVEVEQEITEVIEAALQELPYGDKITSKSLPGRSEVQIEMHESYGPDEVPQIWDETRRRVAEAAANLPPGAMQPLVEDDYGDVYGIFYTVTAPGYDISDQLDIARQLTTELKQVDGVAKINTNGLPIEAVFIEISQERLTQLGLPLDLVFSAIGAENQINSAGTIRHGPRRLRIAPEQAFDTLNDIANMRIGLPGTTEILRLGDIAEIKREPIDNQPHLIRHDGIPAFSLEVSVTEGENVVSVGKAVDKQLESIVGRLPIGVEIHTIYAQHHAVEAAISDFTKNLVLSVGTVFAALFIFMGWRAGIVVGSVLLLTVMGSLGIMSLFNIELQRISLGALMIAMGMLVDNAIVVAEGMLVSIRLGLSKVDAAVRAVQRTQWPLLGATAIGILAFAPIGLSDDSSGYFLRSLFQVVLIALALSWLLAISVVPLLGSRLLKTGESSQKDQLYVGWGYTPYRALLGLGLRHAWLATVAIVAITLACFSIGQYLKTGFFPGNNTPLIYVEFQLAQGTDIHVTREQIASLEAILDNEPGVVKTSSFIGRGAARFTATARPEQPNPAYAQMLVEVQDISLMPTLMAHIRSLLEENFPHAAALVRRQEFSPGGNYKIEARFSGPDPAMLRELGERTFEIYLDHQLLDRSLDWREPELELVPQFDEVKARISGITRRDVAQALAYSTDGVVTGLFRDGDKALPIMARAPASERINLQGILDRLVWSPTEQTYVPMSQVIDGFDTVATENLIWRRDRIRTLNARANPPLGHNPTQVFNALRDEVEAIPLPPGYTLAWGGEYEGSQQATELLLTKVPLTFGSMFVITLLMFGQIRQAIVIWLSVPMCACGLIIVLVATNLTLTFPAILGFLSLIGMLIKNCIVLVDEIDKRIAEERANLETILIASLSRLRPVALAAGTTIAGMAPLLTDVFFKEMAVGIMGGLAFATLITLFAVPVFYRIAIRRDLNTANSNQGRAI